MSRFVRRPFNKQLGDVEFWLWPEPCFSAGCFTLFKSMAQAQKGYLEDSAAFAHAVQARYPPLLEEQRRIPCLGCNHCASYIWSKGGSTEEQQGFPACQVRLMTATWHLGAKLLSFDFVLYRIFVPRMISESKPTKSLACLTLTYYSVQKLARQFHGESSVR